MSDHNYVFQGCEKKAFHSHLAPATCDLTTVKPGNWIPLDALDVWRNPHMYSHGEMYMWLLFHFYVVLTNFLDSSLGFEALKDVKSHTAHTALCSVTKSTLEP